MEFVAMNENEIISAVSSIKNGCYGKITYKSELPVKAAFKKQGISIVKVTNANVRFGVCYENIGSVIEYKETHEVQPLKTGYHWVVPNKISFNENTGKSYVRFASTHNHGAKHSTYFVIENGNAVEFAELPTEKKEIVQNSYWKEKEVPEVQNIKFENILSIG